MFIGIKKNLTICLHSLALFPCSNIGTRTSHECLPRKQHDGSFSIHEKFLACCLHYDLCSRMQFLWFLIVMKGWVYIWIIIFSLSFISWFSSWKPEFSQLSTVSLCMLPCPAFSPIISSINSRPRLRMSESFQLLLLSSCISWTHKWGRSIC